MPGKKDTKAMIDIYVGQIVDLLIKGYTREEVISRYIAGMNKKTPKQQKKENWVPIEKKPRQIRVYINRARARLDAIREEACKHDIALAVEQWDHVYKLALEQNKLKDAISALSGKCRALGLETKKITGGLAVGTYDIEPATEEEKAGLRKRMCGILGITEGVDNE